MEEKTSPIFSLRREGKEMLLSSHMKFLLFYAPQLLLSVIGMFFTNGEVKLDISIKVKWLGAAVIAGIVTHLLLGRLRNKELDRRSLPVESVEEIVLRSLVSAIIASMITLGLVEGIENTWKINTTEFMILGVGFLNTLSGHHIQIFIFAIIKKITGIDLSEAIKQSYEVKEEDETKSTKGVKKKDDGILT